MSIQAGINQSISTLGGLAMLNPSLRAMAEKRSTLKNLKEQEKGITSARDIALQAGQADDVMDYQTKLANVKKAQFETDPSTESFQAYQEAYASTPEASAKRATHIPADPEEIGRERAEQLDFEDEVNYYTDFYRQKAQQATNATVAKQEEKRAGRRHFMSYLKDEPISGGITVGQLSKDAQKQIASKLSKQQRKDLMDRKDAQNV